MPTVLIVGCGSISNQIGIKLLQKNYCVFGIRRNTHKIAKGINPLAIDLDIDPKYWLDLQNLPPIDIILISLAPVMKTEQAYRKTYVDYPSKLIQVLTKKSQAKNLKKIFFLSSTAIYSDNNQEIDENTPAKPDNWRGNILLKAEEKLKQNYVNTTILNSSGIYGEMRWWLMDTISHKDNSIDAYKISNRIHQSDLVNSIIHLIEKKGNLKSRYILTDSHPETYANIITWFAQQSFPINPNLIQYASSTNKIQGRKILNKRLIESGYQFKFPSYKEGYQPQIKPWKDWQKLTLFQKAVLYQVYQIPWGITKSYKDIAIRINSKAYRAVGQALRLNPYPPIIPCHRVIANDGTIGGFSGEKEGTQIELKRQLLAKENIFLKATIK